MKAYALAGYACPKSYGLISEDKLQDMMQKDKFMLCLFISMPFCLYIQIITITSVSVNIFTQFKTDTYSSGF
ncbi:hypothetical protein AXF23_13965 [Prevotella sp. oral taxon 313]|nr:hypothetical protein AXF23_13965 [Prevotella sp. oral taxon 313]